MPWRARAFGQRPLRRRASRPQLKRDPLGGCVRSLVVCSSVLALLLAECSRGRPVAVVPDCPSSWRAAWSSDSTTSLCIPPDFVVAGVSAWGRPGVGTSFLDFLSVELLSWPRDSMSLGGQWPPHIASGANCLADCATADSLTVHVDTIAGREGRTEVGLAPGGEPGFRRKPVLEASWIVRDSVRGWAQGWTRSAATLDTLRAMLRTVRFAKAKS